MGYVHHCEYQLIASCQATINKIKPKVTAADVQTCSHMHHGKKPREKQEVLHKHSQADSRSQQVPDLTALFQYATIFLYAYLCVKRKEYLRCVPLSSTCINLCPSYLKTAQTCSTVSLRAGPIVAVCRATLRFRVLEGH